MGASMYLASVAIKYGVLQPSKGTRIGLRLSQLIARAYLAQYAPWIKNYNYREPLTKLPQPAYYNSLADSSILRLLRSASWVKDQNSLYSGNEQFNKLYTNFDYDGIIKTIFPTKNNAMESVNIAKAWDVSWWNPKNKGRLDLFKKSDVLFADMLVNTQGVYKAKKVAPNSQARTKIKKYFEDALSPHRKHFGQKCAHGDLIDALIADNNLYYVYYPELKKIEDDKNVRRQIGGQKYSVIVNDKKNNLKTKGFIQIPYAIFSEVPNYIPGVEKSFVCVGAVFNDSPQVYHPFDENDQIKRDKWELAKTHFGSTNNNDFIIRVHLGHLHYASAIYTTAFCNLSKENDNLKWFKDLFVDQFAYGLLQVNFLANLTLVDSKEPSSQQALYLRAVQSLTLMQRENANFNILEFNPEILGKDCYQNDSVKLSKQYYKKISFYIDYLFEDNRSSWEGKTKDLGRFVYNQLRKSGDKFDGIPESICHDQTPESLKLILKNLAYLWLIHHGETFSMVSVSNIYYICPTFMRKPLSQFPNKCLSDLEKQQWLASKQIMHSAMMIEKQVTYRNDTQSIISKWGRNPIDNQKWNHMFKNIHLAKKQKGETFQQYAQKDYEEFWNDISVQANEINYKRNKEGLFYLHWLMSHEMPNALNI